MRRCAIPTNRQPCRLPNRTLQPLDTCGSAMPMFVLYARQAAVPGHLCDVAPMRASIPRRTAREASYCSCRGLVRDAATGPLSPLGKARGQARSMSQQGLSHARSSHGQAVRWKTKNAGVRVLVKGSKHRPPWRGQSIGIAAATRRISNRNSPTPAQGRRQPQRPANYRIPKPPRWKVSLYFGRARGPGERSPLLHALPRFRRHLERLGAGSHRLDAGDPQRTASNSAAFNKIDLRSGSPRPRD